MASVLPNASSPQYSEDMHSMSNRPLHAPIIYQAHNHPLLPANGKRAFFFYMDTSAMGYLKMEPGDYLFAACSQINLDRRRPNEDVIKLWVTGKADVPNASQVLDMRQSVLGERSKRTDTKSSFDRKNNSFQGGVEIERSFRSHYTKSRAQTLGPSRQNPAKIVGPARSSKVMDGNEPLDENLQIRRSILDTSSEAAAASITRGPYLMVERLHQRSRISNHLRCGSTPVPGCSTMQLNIAAAQDFEDAAAMHSMGRAGCVHIDKLDHPGCITNMLSCPDIPSTYCPGYMHFLLARVFSTLDEMVMVNFSGLHYHGSTAPIAPEGVAREGWETRMVLVNYPQGLALDGDGILPLAHGPKSVGTIKITPEMRFPEKYKGIKQTSDVATYTREGACMSSQEPHVEFVARELLLMTQYVLSQLPERYKVQLDSDKFLSSISSVIDGKRKSVAPWIDAPGCRQKDASRDPNQSGQHIDDLVDQASIREKIFEDLEQHEAKMARFIPHCVISKKATPLCDEEIETLKSNYDKTNTGILDDALSYKVRQEMDKNSKQRYTVQHHISSDGVSFDGDSDGTPSESGYSEDDIPIRKRHHRASDADTSESTSDAQPRKRIHMEPVSDSNSHSDIDMSDEESPSNLPNGRSDQALERAYVSVPPFNSNPPITHDPAISAIRVNSRIPNTINDERGIVVSAPTHNTRAHARAGAGFKFPVLDAFSLESIAKEKSDLEDDIMAFYHTHKTSDDNSVGIEENMAADILLSSQNSLKLGEVFNTTNMSKSHMDEHHSSCFDIVQAILVLSQTTSQLDHQQTRMDILTRAARREIMLATLRISEWLDKILVNQIKKALVDSTPTQDNPYQWLSPIVHDVHSMVNLQLPTRSFSTEKYGITDIQPPRMSAITRKANYNQVPEDIRDEIIAIVQQIMSDWFQLMGKQDRWKVWVIDALVRTFGTSILVLRSTWDLFRHATKRRIFREYTKGINSLHSSIVHFEHAVESHELVNCRTTRSILEHMQTILNTVLCNNNSGSSTTAMDATMISALQDHRRDNYPIPCAVTTIRDRRDLMFVQFIRQSIAALNRDFARNSPNPLQEVQITDPEMYSPFRDLTPSQIRMNAHDGPFYSNTISTTSGLFSAIIWRAITFRTPFALDRKMVFKDLQEWTEIAETIQDENYICNKSAYGSFNAERSTSNATQYWKAVQTLNWERYCQNTDNCFSDTLELFVQGRRKLFPHLGTSGAYDLTVDLTYSRNIHQYPDDTCIAGHIRSLNRESLHAINYLNGNPAINKEDHDKPTFDQCLNGLQRAAALLKASKLPDHIRIDNMTAENTLCKFFVAFKKGFLSEKYLVD